MNFFPNSVMPVAMASGAAADAAPASPNVPSPVLVIMPPVKFEASSPTACG